MFRQEILNGIDFLMSVQNSDGGIPGIEAVGESACWTTAEALETVLLSPYLRISYHNFVFNMIDFLLKMQITNDTNGKKNGAWPEFATSHIAQTLTTGHALSALELSKKVVVDNDELLNKINESIRQGFTYLSRVQNPDGGWGLEPENGERSKESRALSTIFVLRGYIQCGYTISNNRAVRNACEYLKTLRDEKSGGFKKTLAEAADVCYTARVITTLVKSQAYSFKDLVIKKALKFIFSDKSLKALFKIKHESYVTSTSAGMVTFHSNTPIDVMEALCICNIYDRRVKVLEKWILNTQEDNGGWHLGGTRDPQINDGVITWTTNEAIFALICADNTFHKERELLTEKRFKFAKRVIFTLSVICVLLLLTVSNPIQQVFITLIWSRLPDGVKSFLIVTVLAGLILNLFACAAYDWIKKLINRGGER